MPRIDRRFPGRSADEIYRRVHEVMERIAGEMRLDYRTDQARRTGTVGRMGITGTYAVREDEVSVDLQYPMPVPGALRRRVEARIGEELGGLFV